MARIQSQGESQVVTVDRFLGLNQRETGETQLKLGESPNMLNYRIVDGYKLKTREGYEALFVSLGSYPIRGMWYGKMGGQYYFLFAANGKLYKHDFSTGTNTEIGTLADAKTTFICVDDVVYILNGDKYYSKYYSYDGTTFAEAGGYVPTITVGTPPSGGGTLYEQVNLLTGSKKQLFDGDGTSTVYQLAETNIDSVDSVYVDGVLKTAGTDYTVNLTNGTVTFSTAPSNNTGNVLIQYTKANAANRAIIEKCRYAMLFGGGNDTRLHLWGNPDYPNRRITSGIPVDSSTTALYFPVNMNADIGSYEYAITDIVRQYDRQVIYTEKGTFYSYYELNAGGEASFPIYPLNSVVGNIAPGQVRLILNNPFSIHGSDIYEWVSTTVRDERNAVPVSDKITVDLKTVDLTQAITVDWEEKGEYWVCVGKTIWVCNYRLITYEDASGKSSYVWYKFELTDTPTCFIVIDGEMYFGTTAGQIIKFDPTTRTDNGTAFERYWEMAFYDFGVPWKQKHTDRIWLSIKPETKTRVKINYQTDRAGYSETLEAYYNLLDFTRTDFEHFSFLTSYNPQPFRFKTNTKNYSYFKVLFSNDSAAEIETILDLSIMVRPGGEVK